MEKDKANTKILQRRMLPSEEEEITRIGTELDSGRIAAMDHAEKILNS